MRLFKPTYRDKHTGDLKAVAKWWIETRDHLQIVRRFPAFKDKGQSRMLGEQIERLIVCRITGQQPDRELARWLEHVPPKLAEHFVEIGILDMHRAGAGRPLSEHLEDFKQSLLAKNDTVEHVQLVVSRTQRIFDECGFKVWTDISSDRVERCLANLRQGDSGLSAQTSNHHVQAVKQFATWMVANRRASESPIAHLKRLNVKVDPRHQRIALEIDEVRRLLAATYKGPERFGMTGPERTLLYRFAIESGLRANEIRTLTVSSFNLEACTVTILAVNSKHRAEDVLPIRPETAEELRAFFVGRMPGAKAFGGRYKRLTDRTFEAIKDDLEATVEKDPQGKVIVEAIAYTDAAGRYRDFHSLRHTCGSWLSACGVHPKTIQTIMRHGDINMTMTRYGHTLRGQEAEAISRLPDLSMSDRQAQKATGTDGKGIDLASDLAFSGAPKCRVVQATAENTPAGDSKNAVLTAPGGIRTPNRRFRRPEAEDAKPLADTALTNDAKTDLAFHLARIVEKHPDLARLIEAWPTLSDEARADILRIGGVR
ncbi:MAG: tyrosine-type recombinase/integrase [Candidatus Hydrogenedentales bacterium]